MTIGDPAYFAGARSTKALARVDDRPSHGMSAVLALDLGTTTGWALRTVDGQTISGTQSFRPGRIEHGGKPIRGVRVQQTRRDIPFRAITCRPFARPKGR